MGGNVGQAYLNLLYAQIQKGQVVSDGDEPFGADAAHRGAETSIQLQHCQLTQQLRTLRCGWLRQVVQSANLTRTFSIMVGY